MSDLTNSVTPLPSESRSQSNQTNKRKRNLRTVEGEEQQLIESIMSNPSYYLPSPFLYNIASTYSNRVNTTYIENGPIFIDNDLDEWMTTNSNNKQKQLQLQQQLQPLLDEEWSNYAIVLNYPIRSKIHVDNTYQSQLKLFSDKLESTMRGTFNKLM